MPDLSTAGASYSRFLKNRKKKDGERVSSIKQVLPTIKNKFVGATSGRPRAFNERPYITKGQRLFVSVLFHTPCPARYSVLHLLGVLSGGNEPPLCKGRWLAKQDGGIVKAKISS